MTEEDFLKFVQGLGTVSRIIKLEGIGGKISQEEGNLYKEFIEEDRLDERGYTKIIASKINVCDCGHFANPVGRCMRCGKALCKECCTKCAECGNVFCVQCMQKSIFQKERLYCPTCSMKVLGRKAGRWLLGFRE